MSSHPGHRIRIGQPIKVELDTRYFQFNRQYAVRDVFDALVELITNSDDSYHRLFKNGAIPDDGGPILIECMEQRAGQPHILRVRDRAQGMTIQEMVLKLGNVGARQSSEGDRGFMARGAKDCTELGSMLVESIKDDESFACELTRTPELVPTDVGSPATADLRQRLGIRSGNGTSVTLTIDPGHKMPRIATILRDLPWHFALRDVLSEGSHTRASVLNLNKPDKKPERIVFRPPEGTLVVDGVPFEVPGYPSARASFSIWRAETPFQAGADKRFRRSGLLVKGARAIHQCTLLRPEFENDPHAAHYFGRIDCPYIDVLLDEYDEIRKQGQTPPASNPRLLIDPNRQTGLSEDHPFTEALYQVPSEALRSLIAQDRQAERSRRHEVANKDTKRRLTRLAKVASQFMKEQLEDLSDVSGGQDVDSRAFSERGLVIVPTYVRLRVGDEKKLWLYASSAVVGPTPPHADLAAETREVALSEDSIALAPHPTKRDRVFGAFRVRGIAPTAGTCITATVAGSTDTQAICEVMDAGPEIRDFVSPLEFEHSSYSIREGTTRTIRLFALSPDLVSQAMPPKVWLEDPAGLVVRGSPLLVPTANSNFARADIRVEGRRLNARTRICASANGRSAAAELHVVQKDDDGVPIRFEIRPEDYGNFRAIWADHEGKPNLLLVSAQHKSVNRYLGPSSEGFPGQNDPIFRLLLAEVISESVCRRVLRLDAKEHPWDFRLADYKDDVAIVDTVMAKLHANMRDFVAQAHSVMISDEELP